MHLQVKNLARQWLTPLRETVLREVDKQRLLRQVMGDKVAPTAAFDVELKWLSTTTLPAGAIFDVGANTGLYASVLQAVHRRPVQLFEPLPELAASLRRRFGRRWVHQVALSDVDGEATIRVPALQGREFHTRASLNGHTEPDQTSFRELSIVTRRLDALVDTIAPEAIALVKIDVEGHERSVLRGARETLLRYRPWLLVEIESRHHEFPIGEIFDEVSSLGYRGCFFRPESGGVCDVSTFDGKRDQDMHVFRDRNFFHYLNNFFFVPAADFEAFRDGASAFLNAERSIAFGS